MENTNGVMRKNEHNNKKEADMGYNRYTEKRKAGNERYLVKFIKPTIRMTEEEKFVIKISLMIKGV